MNLPLQAKKSRSVILALMCCCADQLHRMIRYMKLTATAPLGLLKTAKSKPMKNRAESRLKKGNWTHGQKAEKAILVLRSKKKH